MSHWRIWVDTGGTFTDCLALSPEGALRRAKVLSSSALRGMVINRIDSHALKIREQWQAPVDFVKGSRFRLLDDRSERANRVSSYQPAEGVLRLEESLADTEIANSTFEVQSDEEAPVLAARLVTATAAGQPLPQVEMRLATTRGTNALLERNGAATALLITEGFADLLLIGTQQRPDIFALEICKPQPFYQAVIEIAERLDAEGNVIRPLDESQAAAHIARLRAQGITSAAIAFLHSYRNPEHEHRLAEILKKQGFAFISCSSNVAPFIKILPRAQTTVINAYLGPIVDDYFRNVQQNITGGTLHVMTSAGGLVQPGAFHAKDSLLSGPAGGVVGAATSAQRSGFEKIIAFDMGGTSTDACRFDGDFEYVFEHTVGEAHLMAPALAIESVAAGGGSVCWFDGQRCRVGPKSAGAFPGPACYGAGGPLSITDVNLLLGRLRPDQFEIPIDKQHAEEALQALMQRMAQHGGDAPAKEALLAGFLDIANERMADAIRSISVRKGYDPSDYALLAFGGAGGQHACAIAELLGMQTILFPADASLLSAFGIGHARIERFASKQVLQPLENCLRQLCIWLDELAEKAIADIEKEGIHRQQIAVRRKIIHLRYSGQEFSLPIDFTELATLQKDFEQKYRDIYGYVPEERSVEVESVRVIASENQPLSRATPCAQKSHAATSSDSQSVFFGNGWQNIAVYARDTLQNGVIFEGPALIFERHSTLIVHPGWHGRVDNARTVILEKIEEKKSWQKSQSSPAMASASM